MIRNRLKNGFLMLFTGTVLGLAFWLEPDGRGIGTHEQLGLSPCGFMEITEIPCPMCGMTTTFTLLAHVELWKGIQNQPFGFVLFILTVFIFVVSTLEVFFPRDRFNKLLQHIQPNEFRWIRVLILGLIISWIYKIIVFLF